MRWQPCRRGHGLLMGALSDLQARRAQELLAAAGVDGSRGCCRSSSGTGLPDEDPGT
jgi:hypothetical protein